jgi:hypothetical protein
MIRVLSYMLFSGDPLRNGSPIGPWDPFASDRHLNLKIIGVKAVAAAWVTAAVSCAQICEVKTHRQGVQCSVGYFMGEPYAKNEKRLTIPFAEALKTNAVFREWILEHTKFKASAGDALLLDKEMMAKRSKGAANWWVSHHHGACDCFGCKGGKETDLLAVFGAQTGLRFALHFEFKNPKDKFIRAKRQPEAYRLRAECWAKTPPNAVLPHHEAETVLVCSDKLKDFDTHSGEFGATVTLERIEEVFPGLLPFAHVALVSMLKRSNT